MGSVKEARIVRGGPWPTGRRGVANAPLRSLRGLRGIRGSLQSRSMFLELSQLDVRYPGRPRAAVAQVSLGLRAGDIGVLLGPSGCGKTSLLRAVAGLEPVAAGTIRLSKRVVSAVGAVVPPEQRRMGMVFQDYALFPHLSIADNVGFGLAALSREALSLIHI